MKKVETKMAIGGFIGFILWVITNFGIAHILFSMPESMMWASLVAMSIADVPLFIILVSAGIIIPALIWKEKLDYELTPGIWVDAEVVE
jgi:hypothetical protein